MEQPNLDKNTQSAPGRPTNPESARQKRLRDLEERRKNGQLRLGRPVVEGSKRQIQEKEKLAKQVLGVVGKRGRPSFTEEQRLEAERLKKVRQEQDKNALLEKVKAEVLTPDQLAALEASAGVIAPEATLVEGATATTDNTDDLPFTETPVMETPVEEVAVVEEPVMEAPVETVVSEEVVMEVSPTEINLTATVEPAEVEPVTLETSDTDVTMTVTEGKSKRNKHKRVTSAAAPTDLDAE